jgi:valyl-tRNA synthetase
MVRQPPQQSWYLEWIKPGFEQPIDAVVYQRTIGYFEELMQLLHPYMPFVTEEIYHLLKEQKDDLCVKQFTAANAVNENVLAQGELLKQVITGIRDARNKNQLKPKEAISLFIETTDKASYDSIKHILSKQVNAETISYTDEAIAGTIVIAVEKDKFYLKTEKELDTSTLKNDLLKDLEHQKNFLASVERKLGNERFVQNARPEVLALEQKKKADAEARIRTIEESLSTIS